MKKIPNAIHQIAVCKTLLDSIFHELIIDIDATATPYSLNKSTIHASFHSQPII